MESSTSYLQESAQDAILICIWLNMRAEYGSSRRQGDATLPSLD